MKKSKEEKIESQNSEKNEERKRAIEFAMGQIEKQFGKGSIMKLGGQSDTVIPVISTGSLDLDIALGVGGLPVGRIIEIFGPESSGKTTLMLSAVAQAQKKGGVAAFIDAEHALDPSYAKKLGVNIDELLVSQPDNGEEALEICEALVRSNAIDLIVIDSVAALVPKAEIEGDMGDSHMGLQARLMSQALRKLTGTISKSKTIVVFINQIRMKIGVMFGSPETTTGGNALKFYASVRLDIRKIETLKDKEEPIGNRVRVKVVKNKCAPPFRQAEFDIMFNSGINRESSIIDLGVKHDLIVKSGAWYSYNDEKIGQGKESARNFLLQNPEIAAKLEAQIRELNDLHVSGNTGIVAASTNGHAETNGVLGTPSKPSKSKSKNSYLEDELEEAAS
jgi:recombination protein RecA